jgi:uncharacterized membrane protein (DUF485 family)
VNNLDHTLVLLAALLVLLVFYGVLVIVTGDEPKFIQAAIVGTAVAIAAISKTRDK